jgi:hypothetical protein
MLVFGQVLRGVFNILKNLIDGQYSGVSRAMRYFYHTINANTEGGDIEKDAS